MKKELLDYQDWIVANKPKRFSLIDYIHAKLNFEEVAPDLTIALLGLYWPEFCEVDDLIFLKEEFSQEKYQAIISNNDNQIEYWMNLINVDSIFSSFTYKLQKHIASKIAEMWEAKLKADFPDKNFTVKNIIEEEEVYCVFYQVV